MVPIKKILFIQYHSMEKMPILKGNSKEKYFLHNLILWKMLNKKKTPGSANLALKFAS